MERVYLNIKKLKGWCNMSKETGEFVCVVCKERFDNFYKDKDCDSVCKYCVEFELHNETLRKEQGNDRTKEK